MPLPPGYLPREGDVLTVTGVVKYNVRDSDDDVSLNIEGTYTPVRAHLTAVDRVVSYNFEVGDRVLHRGFPVHIRAILGSAAWVESEHRIGSAIPNMTTVPIAELRPCPPAEPESVAGDGSDADSALIATQPPRAAPDVAAAAIDNPGAEAYRDGDPNRF